MLISITRSCLSANGETSFDICACSSESSRSSQRPLSSSPSMRTNVEKPSVGRADTSRTGTSESLEALANSDQRNSTPFAGELLPLRRETNVIRSCLLYTSDAADDLLCVDLG